MKKKKIPKKGSRGKIKNQDTASRNWIKDNFGAVIIGVIVTIVGGLGLNWIQKATEIHKEISPIYLSEIDNELLNLRQLVKEYDQGKEDDGISIALGLKKLLYSHGEFKSFFDKANLLNRFQFINSSILLDPNNLLSFHGLLGIKISEGQVSYFPRIVQNKIIENEFPTLPFEAWWNQIVIDDKKGARFSRKKLVLSTVAFEAHGSFDNFIDEDYNQITKENSLGWKYYNSKKGISDQAPTNRADYESLRAIAEELLVSYAKFSSKDTI